MQRLDGKVALVTGSDSGIGQATAITMAREGADVIVTYYDDEHGAESTAADVRAAGRRAMVAQLDVTDEEAIEKLFDRAIGELGRIDILVNNAGMNAAGIRVADMETDRVRAVMTTNFFGYFWTCRRFIRERLKAGGGGRIINVTSIHEDVPLIGAADYDASKGAQRNLTRTLALELGEHRITVNNVAPGMILTPMNQQAIDDPAARKKHEQAIPMKRAGEPADVAAVVVFLASDEAAYVTGSTYVVDGGLSLQLGRGA